MSVSENPHAHKIVQDIEDGNIPHMKDIFEFDPFDRMHLIKYLTEALTQARQRGFDEGFKRAREP